MACVATAWTGSSQFGPRIIEAEVIRGEPGRGRKEGGRGPACRKEDARKKGSAGERWLPRVPRFSAFVRRGRRAVDSWRLSKASMSKGDGSAAAGALGGPSACLQGPCKFVLAQPGVLVLEQACCVSGRAVQAESGMRPQGSGPLRPKAMPLAIVGCAHAQRGQAGGGRGDPWCAWKGVPGAREVVRVLEEAAQGCLTVGCGL